METRPWDGLGGVSSDIASFIRSGINGNFGSFLLLFLGLQLIASFIRSGINGNENLITLMVLTTG